MFRPYDFPLYTAECFSTMSWGTQGQGCKYLRQFSLSYLYFLRIHTHSLKHPKIYLCFGFFWHDLHTSSFLKMRHWFTDYEGCGFKLNWKSQACIYVCRLKIKSVHLISCWLVRMRLFSILLLKYFWLRTPLGTVNDSTQLWNFTSSVSSTYLVLTSILSRKDHPLKNRNQDSQFSKH